MKKFIVILSVFAATMAQAQKTDAPMATLQHGDQTKVFIGQNAFIEAYNAAADSADVITLSSGYFNVPSNIKKSVSIYGAGMEDDSITGIKATVLSGSLKFIPGDKTDDDGNTQVGAVHVNGVHLEGLYLNYGSISFSKNGNIAMYGLNVVKCKFSTFSSSIPVYDIVIRQSKFNYGSCSNDVVNLLISNSYFTNQFILPTSGYKNVQMDHCVYLAEYYAYTDRNPFNGIALVTNSVLYSELYTGSTARNNIFVGQSSAGSDIQDAETNWFGLKNAGVWAADGEDGSYAASKTFELKYPSKYVGTDGTEVGLHGGLYPWNKVPCTPRITKSEIDATTSVDGKLKVSITAEAQTKE